MRSRRWSILAWQVAIFIALFAVWQWGTQIAWLAKHVKILDPASMLAEQVGVNPARRHARTCSGHPRLTLLCCG